MLKKIATKQTPNIEMGTTKRKKGYWGKIDIQRVDTFNDASGLKALDFSKSFGQGYDAALESLQ